MASSNLFSSGFGNNSNNNSSTLNRSTSTFNSNMNNVNNNLGTHFLQPFKGKSENLSGIQTHILCH